MIAEGHILLFYPQIIKKLICSSKTFDHPPATEPLCPSHSLLHGAELHSDDELSLGGHVLKDVGFQPPQHVRTQHVVELLDLILLSDVGKLLQEAFQVAAGRGRAEGELLITACRAAFRGFSTCSMDHILLINKGPHYGLVSEHQISPTWSQVETFVD